MKAYIPQLDNLRGIAVLLVIISHWFAKEHFINRFSPNGAIGVTIFFVLSGFLITGILLNSKQEIEDGQPVSKALNSFYLKRALRIFPVYYLLITILIIVKDNYLLEGLTWHLSYTSNFYFYFYKAFSGGVTVFWSLSVEEQFYLFWPAIIFLTPYKKIPVVLGVGILVAILFRYCIVTETSFTGRLLMPGSFDSFCIGGSVAYAHFFKQGILYKLLTKYNTEILILSFILFCSSFLIDIQESPNSSFYNAFYFLLISVSFGIWIDRVARGVKSGVFKYVLDSKILRFIGKISYGMYLFHMFIPDFYGINFPTFLKSYLVYIIFALKMAILIVAATASWYLFEKPILRLKERVELKFA